MPKVRTKSRIQAATDKCFELPSQIRYQLVFHAQHSLASKWPLGPKFDHLSTSVSAGGGIIGPGEKKGVTRRQGLEKRLHFIR